MSLVESVQPTMEEESFIILGSTPTPSMENFPMPDASSPPVSVVERENDQSLMVLSKSKMESSTQLDSTAYSLLPSVVTSVASDAQLQEMKSLSESSKALLIASAESTLSQQPPSGVSAKGPLILQSIENKENVPAVSINESRQATASFIIGETQSILHQFPSLVQSSMSIEEMHLLQKLSMEHSQLKESLQRANVAMRKNFTSIQQLQDETKTRYAQQETRIAEQQMQIEELTTANEKLMEQNDKLTGELNGVKSVAAERNKQLENCRQELQTELEEITWIRDVERKSAQSEVDELRKQSSERQSVIQNLAKQIENLELQIKGFVVVATNKPEKRDCDVSFVPADIHKQKIKALEAQMSEQVAKNLEFEDMRKLYIDEINCLKTNVNAAEQVFASTRLETQKLYEDIKERDSKIEHLHGTIREYKEKMDVLTAQSDIFQKDFEAERAGRQELASEKSRILAEFEVLQRQNAELTAKVSVTDAEREQLAQRAAQLVHVATNGEETASLSPASEDAHSEPRSLLRCPLCLKGYKELATLQSHAAFCMGVE